MAQLSTRALVLAGCVAALAVCWSGYPSPCPGTTPGAQLRLEASQASPVAFVPNHGQWEGALRYRAAFGGMTAFLEEAGWTLALRGGEEGTSAAVRMRFAGDESRTELVPEGRLPGHHDYFLGSDPARWRTEVPLYAAAVYREVWPGVDVRVYEKDGHLEYDLVLQPGADLARVEIAVEGAEPLRIDERGALVIETAVGPLRQSVPVTWQARDGEKRELACRYVLRGPERFGFEVDGWDHDLALTIDPGLTWSTLVDDRVIAASVGENGTVTVAGSTRSPRCVRRLSGPEPRR